MKVKRFLTKRVAIILSCVLCVTGITLTSNAKTNSTDYVAQVRTVELSALPNYDCYLEDFSEKFVSYDDEQVSFHGKTDYNEKILSMFDKVSLSEGISEDESNIVYDCSFDMESMQFLFKATLLDELGNPIEIEEITTDAFVTENGRLDAYIELDGETYLISDFVSTEAIDECLFGWLKAIAVVVVVVVVYVVVAETAEQIRAKKNYEYNKKLERDGKGVNLGTYVTDQSNSSKKGNSPANYRFGFTSFKGVGCEVAAAYNAMIALGKSERLSETIYSFEKWAIEFAFAWGSLGSNPLQISTYLNKKGIGYKKIINYSSFKSDVENKTSCHIIMSRWNAYGDGSLHTFYVHKKTNSLYYGYNWKYDEVDPYKRDNLDAFNNGNGFIVGYIVWKK